MDSDIREVTTDEWLAQVRARLAAEREEHTSRLGTLTTDTGEPGEVHDQAALAAAARQSLAQVTAALQRIDDGAYGYCERCGGEIPRERLEILPHARFCVPCQEKQG